ncbi:sigma 54-dependent Fis family transcriptional regulator [Corallococcus silvisoli]|uniref:sigma 54-dependent Fis family transcriptional regulator n=1 Tax=Corallococcus silvisoli TaxID=2697031 RepID=UPI0013764FF8|nr:sigma 54-interacting transcriptional regulator [Corallococcus silvisoli]NBD09661.1 FHA domain-containing protein [Corallococcus silvisoli]
MTSRESTRNFRPKKEKQTQLLDEQGDTSDDSARITYREPKALRVEREGIDDLLVPLYPDRSYVFGRAPESTVVFPHDAVSRQHGRLSFREDDRWVYRDLNSRNRSFLHEGDWQRQGDERESSLIIPSAEDYVVEAGHTILLGNGRSRITLLAEAPRGLLADPRTTKSRSPATKQLELAVSICSRHQLPVFILGRSGTGKTFIAREIHTQSRATGNFVILNCGRLPTDVNSLSSELLGHVKGAFTGAVMPRIGKFFSANGGTLFLDEVEFLPPIAQDFLIDILEGSGSFAPLGAPPDFRDPPPRFRLVSASKTPLQETELRPDLAQRLAAGDVIVLPSLEERREDIPVLIDGFLHQLFVGQQYDAELTSDALAHLQKAEWPGQIRELEATIRAVVSRAAAIRDIDGVGAAKMMITLEAVKTYLSKREQGFGASPKAAQPKTHTSIRAIPYPPPRKRPGDLTKEDISESLRRNQGNKTRAASDLGIAPNTLKARMRALSLE